MGKFVHAFWHIEGNCYSKLEKIFRYFKDFQFAWEKAGLEEFRKAGIGEEFARKVVERRGKLDLGRSLEILWKNDVFLVDRAGEEFPDELRNIAQSPFLLYRKGASLQDLSNRVAIVGMRKATIQGERLAFGLARQLGMLGVTVVSGLAFGIDAAAHEGTLKADGKTIGILASGIGKITPTTHNNLAQRILAKGGAIISEYPVTADALKFQFLERNRLIAGLSHTTVVVEAAKKSGALITAGLALEQGRNILAFPGDPGKISSQGCNNLIRDGEAGLVSSISDVQQNLMDRELLGSGLGLLVPGGGAGITLDNFDRKILEMVGRQQLSTDELEVSLGMSEKVLESLCKLEMAALMAKNSQMKWQLLAD